MKISDLFRRDSGVRSLNSDAIEEKNGSKGARPETAVSDDTISISPKARQFRQIANIVNEDESARSQKVAELKQRVANGGYSVSSADVAQSIVSYATGKDE
mgnify:CR=1 FL=1